MLSENCDYPCIYGLNFDRRNRAKHNKRAGLLVLVLLVLLVVLVLQGCRWPLCGWWLGREGVSNSCVVGLWVVEQGVGREVCLALITFPEGDKGRCGEEAAEEQRAFTSFPK